MTNNEIHLKVWGEWACFTRPEMKVERVSYPVITPSAARGILEAIFWKPQIYYTISQISVIQKGSWASIRRNEIQDIISPRTVKAWMEGKKPVTPVQAGGGAADGTQRNMLALRDVAYVISAEVATTKLAQSSESLTKYTREFQRRAELGKCYHRPGLGMREFAADFNWVSNPTQELESSPTINEDLGVMLYDVFSPRDRHKGFMWNSKPKSKKDRYIGHMIPPRPCYFRAQIKDSRLSCHPNELDIIYPS